MTRDKLIKEIAFPIWQRRLWENGWGRVEYHPREKFDDSWKSWETADELIKDGMTIAHAVATAELALSAIEAAGVTLCPNEPTLEMLDAYWGADWRKSGNEDPHLRFWKAILADDAFRLSSEAGEGGMSTLKPDITPESHPNHHTVGKRFRGWNLKKMASAVFYCESHDASGYNMVTEDGSYRSNVSERAIGRTFHEIVE